MYDHFLNNGAPIVIAKNHRIIKTKKKIEQTYSTTQHCKKIAGLLHRSWSGLTVGSGTFVPLLSTAMGFIHSIAKAWMLVTISGTALSNVRAPE